MKEREFLSRLAESVGVDVGSLTKDVVISAIQGWDSICWLDVIALVDQATGVTIDAGDLSRVKTIGDLLSLVDGVKAFDRA
jgi:acyl carrier protein